jgi:deoxyhypusine synthase
MDSLSKDIQKELQQAQNNTLFTGADLKDLHTVRGYDLNQGVDYDKIFAQYQYMGIQATNIGKGIKIINKMIDWELKDDPTVEKDEDDLADPLKKRCKIFLGYTSACITSGLRETIRYLVEHKMVNVIVTPVTGIDEDLMKCFGSHQVTGFTENLSNQVNPISPPNLNLSTRTERPMATTRSETSQSRSATSNLTPNG